MRIFKLPHCYACYHGIYSNTGRTAIEAISRTLADIAMEPVIRANIEIRKAIGDKTENDE